MGCHSSTSILILPTTHVNENLDDGTEKKEKEHVHLMYCQLFRELLSKMNETDRSNVISHCPDLYIDEENLAQSISNNEQLIDLMNYLRDKIADENPLVALGRLMLEMGSYDRAEYFYLQTLPIEQDNWMRQAAILNNLGKISHDQEKYDQALKYYESALELQRKHISDDHPSLSTDYSNIGTVHQQQNRPELALNYFQRALKIQMHATTPDEELIALFHNNIGLIYNEQEKFSQGQIHHEKCLQMNEKLLPSTHPSLALSHHNLAISLVGLGRTSDAFDHIEKAIEITSQSLPNNHPQRIAHQELLSTIRKRIQQ